MENWQPERKIWCSDSLVSACNNCYWHFMASHQGGTFGKEWLAWGFFLFKNCFSNCFHHIQAFSTDNGQVGFLEALSQNKSVKFSSYHHKKEVYKLLWGPPIESDNSKPKTSLTVFSVGDFKLVQHPYLDKPAVVVNNLLKNQSGRDMKISQALFQQGDFKNLVVGYFDGTVEVFSYPELNRTCIIKSITKMITVSFYPSEWKGT